MEKRRANVSKGFIFTVMILALQLLAAGLFAQTNVAVGKSITASSVQQNYVATNANDNSTTTYWEGAPGTYPNLLTVDLGADYNISSIVGKLNPDAAWATRNQTIEVLGKKSADSAFTSFGAAASYTFNPATGNSVTIPETAKVARWVQLKFTANTGSTGAQLAEFQVFGTPVSSTEASYGNNGAPWPINDGAIIQTENYDVGGSGVAYSDSSAGNTGGAYRSDDVDIEATGDSSGAYNVGWIASGEWLNYSVAATAGTYTISARVASGGTNIGQLQVLLGSTVLGTITVPNTGAWQSYVDATITGIAIPAGNQILQLKAVNGGDFNINYIKFTTGSNPVTYALTVNSGSGSGNYAAGTVVPVVANSPASGMQFSNWTGPVANATAASTTVTMPAAATTVTANYVPVTSTYVLTVNNGSGTGSYASGTVVSIVANAAQTGQTFSTWTGGTSANYGNISSASTTYQVTGNATLTATYVPVTVGSKYEAENAALSGGAAATTNHTGYSGSGFVEGYWAVGAATTFSVSVASAGYYDVDLRYGNGFAASNISVYVNGVKQIQSALPTTGSWEVWGDKVETFGLNAGVNTIAYKYDSGDGANINLDYISLAATTISKPDLAVSNITWSPGTPVSGNAITLAADVSNTGTGVTSGTIKVSFRVSGTEVATGSYTGALAVGATQKITASSSTTQYAGTYSLTAVVDPDNSIAEFNESNNSASASMAVGMAPGSDLTITKVSYSPLNPAVGVAVSFSATLANIGRDQAPSGVVVQVKIGSTTLTGTSSSALNSGSSLEVVLSGTWAAVNGSNNAVATADPANVIAESNETNNTASVIVMSGRGAAVPYTRYEADIGTLAGGATVKTSPDFDLTKVASQASNQSYVELSSSGSSVQWTVGQNNVSGVTMRFTLPDTADGMGQAGSVTFAVTRAGVTTTQTINLTSYYAWQYFLPGEPGDSPSGTPQINNGIPSNLAAFAFDEAHWLLSTPMNAGDTMKIQSNGGAVVGVDFLEIESVPTAIGKPAGAVSVTDYGASSGAADNLAAFNAAVTAALASSSKTLYIPAGTFKLSSMWVVQGSAPITALTITGAGMWYTNIQFTNSQAYGGGVSFKMAQTGKMDFSNMYLNSNLRSRYSQGAVYKAFMDEFGTGSRIHDIWEEHFECGFWVGDYHHTPAWAASDLVISNSRIRNNLADGVNFCQGTSNSTVENCSIRNNGDDGLAVWPDATMAAPMGVNNTFTHNTIEFIWRSAGIAIYGGSGHKATFNTITDGFMSAGIRLNGTFPGYHFENNTGITFSDTTITNCGTSFDVFTGELGAINLEASAGQNIKNLTFTNMDVVNAQKDGYQMGESGGFTNIQFINCTLNGSGRDGITHSKFSSAHLGAAIFTYGPGAATFTNFVFSNAAGGKVVNPVGFVLTFN